jgi:hypothetical protein
MKSEIEEIKEVLEGWKNKELTDCAAICLVHDTLYPAPIEQEDIDWARLSRIVSDVMSLEVFKEIGSKLEENEELRIWKRKGKIGATLGVEKARLNESDLLWKFIGIRRR